jgi:hypothetical protein
MSNITREKLIERLVSIKSIGKEKTAEKYNISEETLSRYLREARQRQIDIDFYYKEKKQPKILLLDIETLPMEIYVWGLFKQRPNIQQVDLDWCVLSWTAKWLNDNIYYKDILTSKECYFRYNRLNDKKDRNRVDKKIVEGLYTLMDEADIIIGHNLNRFDHRKMTARFIELGLKPLSPFQSIDTLTHSRKLAMFTSHKLDYLGQLERNHGKLDTDFQLWKDCVIGNQEALDRMLAYNIEDVALLEEIYLWLRPYMKGHPNLGLYYDLDYPVCPNCGHDVVETDKYYYTTVNKYTVCKCKNCGSYSRLRNSAIDKDTRRHLISTVAR